MIRAAQIGLVMMGGGLFMSAVYGQHEQARRCAEARRQNLPNAEQICASSSSGSSWHSHFSSYGSSSSGSSSSAASSATRGGFGATGAHFASAGG
jgi:hypothetical protein